MAKQVKNTSKTKKVKIPKPDRNFQLIKAIRGKPQKNNDGEKPLHKANIKVRDKRVRKLVENEIQPSNTRKVFPGQLVMFNYFTPKTEEQLKYYDAMPCTIFFGIIKTKDGPRVIGFNIHYYPPRIRYQVMDRIFEIFKPVYLDSWGTALQQEIPYFNYRMIISQLQKAKLDFGIREYIPQLMHQVKLIPPMYWQKAVFSEGHFRKETREQILNYWKNKSIGIEKKP